ncbi:hypothetical protein MCOR25_000158 [Pyricularia grisea]|nr:hypothetical protein MCOR25_000158 [Pyricularia grisea]
MQFSTILFTLFASVALTAPAVDSPSLQARQGPTVDPRCDGCRRNCFFTPGPDAVYRTCIDHCNKDLPCHLSY